MVMKTENNKWYIGWIIFPVWYLIGKKYILLPVIQSVFEETSYSDAYLIANYLWIQNILFYLCKISYLTAVQYVWTAVILEKLLLVLVTNKAGTEEQ